MSSNIVNDNFINNIPVPFIKVQLDSNNNNYLNFYVDYINNSMLNLFNNNKKDFKSTKHLLKNSYEIREIIASYVVEHVTTFKKYIPIFTNWFKIDIQIINPNDLMLYFTPILHEYKEILHSMSSSKKMFFIKDKFGDYVDCDEKFALFANCDKKTIYKKTDIDLWGSSIGKAFTESHLNAVANKETYVEKICRIKNRFFSVERYLIYSDNDELVMVIGVCEEIHSSVIDDYNVHNYKKIIQLIEDTTPDIIYYKNIDGSFMWCNNTMAQSIGVAKEDIIGKTNKDIKSLNHLSQKCDITDKEVLQLKSKRIYYDYMTIGDEEKYYEVIKSPLFDNYNNVIGLVGILRDISHRTMLEEEMDKLRLEFFANLSHELRTPVNLISSSLQLINRSRERNDLNNENLPRYLDIIAQNGDRLLKLINNLIDSTKLDSNYLDYCPQNKDVIAFIEGICMYTVDFAKQNNIELIFDTQIEEKVASFDPDKLERIILNLLSNSIKYNKPNGKIFVDLDVKDDILEIKIKDTGIGIPTDKLNFIFNKFKQVDNRFTKINEGSGLGLYIVKSLVELHSGTISVSSTLGKETEFTINIPCNNEQIINCDDLNKEIKNDLNKRIQIEFSDIY